MVLEIVDKFGCLADSGQLTEQRAALIESIASKLPSSDYKLLQLIAASGLIGGEASSGEVISAGGIFRAPGSGSSGVAVDFHNDVSNSDEATSVLLTPNNNIRLSFNGHDPSFDFGHFVSADTNINISGDSYKNLKMYLIGDSVHSIYYTLYK